MFCFFYKGALMWNALPTIERNIDRYDKFKGVQKKKLLDLLDVPNIEH